MYRALLSLLLMGFIVTSAFAAEPEKRKAETDTQKTLHDDSKVYLQPLELVENKDTTQRITQTDMERVNASTLWEAMQLAPGVTLSSIGQRNDARIAIRGFSQSQVRIMLDGIPVYIPYDGNEDIARNLVGDLESIEVSKGYSSVLTGANALGGVVNLVSARPQKELEFKAHYRNYWDSRGNDMARHAMASAGSKQDLYFFKLTGAFVERDFFRISDDFRGSPSYIYNSPHGVYPSGPHQNQGAGKRTFSGYRDKKLNVQAGLTPTQDSEIVLRYITQRGTKEQPLYAGKNRASTTNTYARNWSWPYWDKDSYSLSTKFSPLDDLYVKANIYYDTYTNKLLDYANDWTHTIIDNASIYDDHAYGGRVETGYKLNEIHKIAASLAYRRDTHNRKDKQIGPGVANNRPALPSSWQQTKQVKDDLWIAGLEYTVKPVDRLSVVLGTSYTNLKPVKAKDSSDNWGTLLNKGNGHETFDGQGALFFDITDNHQVYGTIARKTRMPSMLERYRVSSNGNPTGAGTISWLPNPALKPEKALHLEAGYRGTILGKVKPGLAIFYSDVKDLIAQTDVNNPYGSGTVRMYDNISKASFAGLELTLDAIVADWLSMGMAYSYIDWTLHKVPEVSNQNNLTRYLTALPHVKASAYLNISPIAGLSLVPRMEYRSESYYSASRGASSSPIPKNREFCLAHFKATYDITENFQIEAGVENVFDTYYEYEEGYPMQGRTFFTGVTVRF